MKNVALMLRPGAEPVSWPEFCETHPPYSIALDGYVSGASRYDGRGPWLNLDHHADVDRLATRATCSQVLMSIRQGLFDAFRDWEGPRAQIYVNDCDEDVCLSWFLLQNPQAGCLPSNTRLDRLIHAVDLLDTTAGASLHPLDLPLMSEIAWIFEPYRLAKLQGVLDRPFASLHRLVIDAVGQRIRDHLADKGQALPLDTRYERIGGGKGWALVREIGAQSRVGMIADGIRAYVSPRPLADGAWSYAIGRVSPFVPFDVPAILRELNAAEDYQRGTWGGGNLVGGSPRLRGSALAPHEVTRIVNRVIGRAIPARCATHSSKEISMSHRRLNSSSSRNQALKRLFALQEFSLANYASQAQLYAGGGQREYLATIVEIAEHQASRAAAIGNLLSTRGVFLQRKGFPMCFTGLNYLSAAHVARRMLVKQPELIAAIRECVEHLHGDHEGQALARRILASEGENLRHLKRVLGETFDASANMKIAA